MDPELNPAQITQDPLSFAPEGQAAPPTTPAPPPAPAGHQISDQEWQEFQTVKQRWEQAAPALQEYKQMLPAYQQMREQQRIQAEEQEILAKAAQYEALGVDPAAARQVAQDALTTIRQHRQEAERVRQEAQEMQAFESRKRAFIAKCSKEFGVPPTELEAFDDAPPMLAYARLWKRTADIEKAANDRLKGRVAAQNFESGAGGGGGTSHATYLQSLKEGKPLPASDEIDRIVAQAMRQG